MKSTITAAKDTTPIDRNQAHKPHSCKRARIGWERATYKMCFNARLHVAQTKHWTDSQLDSQRGGEGRGQKLPTDRIASNPGWVILSRRPRLGILRVPSKYCKLGHEKQTTWRTECLLPAMPRLERSPPVQRPRLSPSWSSLPAPSARPTWDSALAGPDKVKQNNTQKRSTRAKPRGIETSR